MRSSCLSKKQPTYSYAPGMSPGVARGLDVGDVVEKPSPPGGVSVTGGFVVGVVTGMPKGISSVFGAMVGLSVVVGVGTGTAVPS